MHSTKALAALITVLASAGALSQVRPDAGSALRQSEPGRAVPAQRQDAPVVRGNGLPERALPGDAKIRVTVKGFRFIGNTVLGEPQLAALVAEAVGKEAGVEELNDAVRKVRRAYLDRGYFLAQAYLPEQEIRDGVVTIAVLEGRLSNIKVEIAPDAGVSEKLIRGIVSQHLGTGSYITEQTLERPLLLIRDLPGLDAESTIQAGDRIGYADLIVRVKKGEGAKRIDGSVDFDNHGNRFSGEYRLGLTANWNNPAGFGDLVTLRAYQASENGTFFGRLGYVIPVWVDGTRAGVSAAHVSYALGKDFANTGAEGEADVLTGFIVHPLLRTRSANVFLQVSYDRKQTLDRTAGLTDDRRKIRVATMMLSGDLRDRYLGLNQGYIGFHQGKLDIENPALLIQDQTLGPFAQGVFRKWTYEYRRLQQIRPGMNLLFSVTGQWASKNMTSAEKFVLGGAERVRAYPDGEAAGDNGYYGTLEFRYQLPGVKLGPAETLVSAFYDFGAVESWANPQLAPTAGQGLPNTRRISGAGVGLTVGQINNFMVRADVAWRTDEVPISDTKDTRPRFWLQAIKWF